MTPAVALLENLPDAILLLDERGAVAYANVASERIFGRPIAELAGAMLGSLLAEPYGEEYDGLLAQFRAGEQLDLLGQPREVVAQGQDGSGFAGGLARSGVAVGQ